MDQMLPVLIVSPHLKRLTAFLAGLRADPHVKLSTATGEDAALAAAGRLHPVLAVVDAPEGEASPADLVRRLLERDAFLHTAVFSDLEEEEFHRQMEGLGILARLPSGAGHAEAVDLLDRFRDLAG